MMDWTRHNEVSTDDPDRLIWNQIICSLLYDEVAVQDETIVCSRKLPQWFGNDKGFRLLEELFDCGGLRVLKRPLEAYPSKYKDIAQECPITGRRLHLKDYSVGNAGQRLRFTKKQVAFHSRLDSYLNNTHGRHTHRFAGSKRIVSTSLFKEFGDLLVEVLTADKWQWWLNESFKHITERSREDFEEYVRNPELAVRRIEDSAPGEGTRLVPSGSGPLQLTTAIAVRVAMTYGGLTASELQDLIETVFAQPYCKREGADGRFGRHLHELPVELDSSPLLDEPEEATPGQVEIVQLRLVDVPLPTAEPGFAAVVNEVRSKTSCQELRRSMESLDYAVLSRREGAIRKAIDDAADKWTWVADDFAREYSRNKIGTKGVTLATFTVSVLKDAFYGLALGSTVDTIKKVFTTMDPTLPSGLAPIIGAAAGLAMGAIESGVYQLVGDSAIDLLRRERQRLRLKSKLRRAVDWRRVPHPAIGKSEAS